ncbi:hypothetical protein R1sor_003854 [Riccia sorocarpa]|uniref:DUF7880 domain-containing protein n=1 Tax=Riccia sorocarpa TaxID=122646 RepID=A0ABD3H2V5_9MARC
MACSTGNFSVVIECGIRAPRCDVQQQFSQGNSLRTGTPISVTARSHLQLSPMLRNIVVSRIRALNFEPLESKGNADELESNSCVGRRDIITGLIGASVLTLGTDALASDVPAALGKYIKRKKLDPLETYVPTILLAQSQFQEVDGQLDGEPAKLADARSLLRYGPAASLRTDIRAVAQYAAESGNEGGASAAVDRCLSALEDLDGLLLQASRRSQGAPVEKMRQRVSTVVTALDSLLATVPAAILEKGKAIAKAYKESS